MITPLKRPSRIPASTVGTTVGALNEDHVVRFCCKPVGSTHDARQYRDALYGGSSFLANAKLLAVISCSLWSGAWSRAAYPCDIVASNAETAFGREHSFGRIRDVTDYRSGPDPVI